MDTMEQQMLEDAAAIMAEELLKRPGVRGVQLIDVPRRTDSRAKYRLLVVADNELADQYKQRLLTPALISYRDGDDNNATWWDERMETPQEAAFYLLGIDETTFYETLGEVAAGEQGISFYDVRTDGDIDIILLPEGWVDPAAQMLERLHVNHGCGEYRPLLPLPSEAPHARDNYRVFDPSTRTFVSPR